MQAAAHPAAASLAAAHPVVEAALPLESLVAAMVQLEEALRVVGSEEVADQAAALPVAEGPEVAMVFPEAACLGAAAAVAAMGHPVTRVVLLGSSVAGRAAPAAAARLVAAGPEAATVPAAVAVPWVAVVGPVVGPWAAVARLRYPVCPRAAAQYLAVGQQVCHRRAAAAGVAVEAEGIQESEGVTGPLL